MALGMFGRLILLIGTPSAEISDFHFDDQLSERYSSQEPIITAT